MNTRKIARERVREFIKKTNGKIFSIEFEKVDGSRRKMVARLGVTSHLRGGSNKVESIERPYMTVFDMQKKEYRTINPRTTQKIKIDGVEWEVV